MTEVVTLSDLDKEFRREAFNLLHQLEVNRMNAIIYADNMKALAFKYRQNAGRINGRAIG